MITQRQAVVAGENWRSHGHAANLGQLSNSEMFARIQELVEANTEMARCIGRIDHVSQLPNRVQFLEDFERNAAAEGHGSLILVTLAEAKHFNDLLRALGHAYAEDFVRAGAERVISLLPPETQLYHVSVLSFAFFSEVIVDGRPPAVVGEIVDALRTSLFCQDIPVDTKAGVGVTVLEEMITAPSELLRATLAAAQDSRLSFDGWAWYNRKTDKAHVRAFRLLTDLPAAFTATDQLSLNFQPRIDLRGGGCVSAEALLRWSHPVMGMISPGEFVPLAETTALIQPLTDWVINAALRAVRHWQDNKRGLKISVNISPRNLEEPGFIETLGDRIRQLGIDPSLVELEFTEGVLATNWPLMIKQLERLRGLGFEIAIDDFGTGYSNMSYLGKIPAKYLKIDQSFVRPLHQDARNQLLVRSIIGLAHALDYQVVAEGIETGEAFKLLSDWGCDEGQGYFMSRPLTQPDLMDWLGAQR